MLFLAVGSAHLESYNYVGHYLHPSRHLNMVTFFRRHTTEICWSTCHLQQVPQYELDRLQPPSVHLEEELPWKRVSAASAQGAIESQAQGGTGKSLQALGTEVPLELRVYSDSFVHLYILGEEDLFEEGIGWLRSSGKARNFWKCWYLFTFFFCTYTWFQIIIPPSARQILSAFLILISGLPL